MGTIDRCNKSGCSFYFHLLTFYDKHPSKRVLLIIISDERNRQLQTKEVLTISCFFLASFFLADFFLA